MGFMDLKGGLSLLCWVCLFFFQYGFVAQTIKFTVSLKIIFLLFLIYKVIENLK